MNLSARGAEMISRWEGFRAEPYNDAAGHATVGYGHLLHKGRVTAADQVGRWVPGQARPGVLTRGEALALLTSDARAAAVAVARGVRVPLAQHEFDALVSFTFNVGSGAFAGSTLLRLLNQGRKDLVPAELRRWVRAGGRVLPGLANRRAAEIAMWQSAPIAEAASRGGLAHLRPDEYRWAREHDALHGRERLGVLRPTERVRLRVLRRTIGRRADAIHREAERTSWDVNSRRRRHRSLAARRGR